MSKPTESRTSTISSPELLSVDITQTAVIEKQAAELKESAEKDLAGLLKRIGINIDDGLPTLADSIKELDEIKKELKTVYTPSYKGDVVLLMKKLITTQDRFLVALKKHQIDSIQKVIDGCKKISEATAANKIFEIPTHAKALQHSLRAIETMPSLTRFEVDNAEFANMVSLLDPRIINSDNLEGTEEFRASIEEIDKTSTDFTRPFLTYLENQERKLEDQLAIPAPEGMSTTLRDNVTGKMEEVIQSLIEKKQEALAALETKLELARRDFEAASERLSIAQRPKPFSFGRFFGRLLNTKTYQRTIATERKEVADLSARVETTRAAESKATEDRDNVGYEIDYAEGTLTALRKFKTEPKFAEKEQTDMSPLVRDGASYAQSLLDDPVIRRAAFDRMTAEEKREAKKQHFKEAIKQRFERGFWIARLVKEGAVNMASDGTTTGLDVLKGVVQYAIPVPVVQQGALALIAVAKCGHNMDRRARLGRIADSSTDPEVTAMVEEIADTLVESYSHSVDDDSVLDRLSEKGLTTFANSAVDQIITSMGTKKPAWRSAESKSATSDAEVAALDAVSAEIAEEVTKQLVEYEDGKEITDPKDSAHRIVGWLLEGKEFGTVPKQISELRQKKRLGSDEVENPRTTKSWNIQGLLRRVGVVTRDGERYTSTEREEGKLGKGSKYLWRLATPTEEARIASAKARSAASPLKGYERFVPAIETYRAKLASLVATITREDCVDVVKFEDRESLLQNLIEEYATKKSEGATPKELDDFLKANDFLKIGESKRDFIGRLIRDETRIRFNKLKVIIVEAAEAKHLDDLAKKEAIAEGKGPEATSFFGKRVATAAAVTAGVLTTAGAVAAAVINDGDISGALERGAAQIGSALERAADVDVADVATSAERLAGEAVRTASDVVERVAETAGEVAKSVVDSAERTADAIVEGVPNRAAVASAAETAGRAALGYVPTVVTEGNVVAAQSAKEKLSRRSDSRSTIASAESEDAEEAEETRKKHAGQQLVESGYSKKSLESILNGLVGRAAFPTAKGLQAAMKAIGGDVTEIKSRITGKSSGKKVTLPAITFATDPKETAPVYIVVELDTTGNVSKVELCGGDKEGHKRMLFDKSAVKEKHRETVPNLLERYEEMLTIPRLSVKEASASPVTSRGPVISV